MRQRHGETSVTWIRLQGVKIVQAKGRVYAYHRGTGKRLKAAPTMVGGQWSATPALIAEVAAIEAVKSVKAGTVHALIASYREARAFGELSDRTKKDYRAILIWMADRAGNESPRLLTPVRAREIRDVAVRKHGFRFGKYVCQVMRVVWQHGVDYGFASDNPWRAVSLPKRPKGMPEANRPWTPGEVLVALGDAPIGLARAYALTLMGFRPSEVPGIAWTMLTADGIVKRSDKTAFDAVQPVPVALAHLFASDNRPAETIASNRYAKPFTVTGLAKAAGEHLAKLHKAGKIGTGCTLKGLNHTLGTALAERGVDPRAARDAMQKKSMVMAEHYSRRADTRANAKKALGELDEWLKKAPSLENSGRKVGKPPRSRVVENSKKPK